MNYTELVTAVSDYTENVFNTADMNMFIRQAEAVGSATSASLTATYRCPILVAGLLVLILLGASGGVAVWRSRVISENASKLTDIVRLAPHVQEGEVVGFRVNPGKDRGTFEALGLKPGDVVTNINGTALNDPGQGLQVFESLGESTQANVTLLRDGTPQVIVIDTTQLKKLQEKRE